MARGKPVGNTEFQKKANDALILDLLRRNENLSRIELVERTGLHQSTVTYIVNRLVAHGIVVEKPEGGFSEKRGRKPIPLMVNKQFGYVVGLDLCGRKCHLVVCDITGDIKYVAERTTSASVDSYEEGLLEHYRHIEGVAAGEGWKLLALGVSISGVVDPVHGIVKRSWMEDLSEYPLAQRLRQRIGLPVLVENDANCCAYSKLWWERKNDQNPSFLYLLLRDTRSEGRSQKHRLPLSIGLGFVLEGTVYHGVSYLAGEYRSVSLPRGMVENQLSLSDKRLECFAVDEDTRRTVMNEILSNMILLLIALNPDTLYIGGDFPMSEDWLSEIIEGKLETHTKKFSQIASCKIRSSGMDLREAAYGACAFVLSSVYSIPMIGRKSSLGPLDWDTLFSLAQPSDPSEEAW